MVILAVDYGDTRTGLAVCDKNMMLASPAGLITEPGMNKTVIQIVEFAKEHKVDRVVVGLPKNMDGTLGERANACMVAARKIRGRLQNDRIPVDMYDERVTTVAAIGYLNEMDVRGKERKQTVDQLAAAIILEGYMTYLKNNGEDSFFFNNY